MKHVIHTLIAALMLMMTMTASAGMGIMTGKHLNPDGGQSVTLFADLNVGNQAFGWYVTRTYEGSDPDNVFVGVDYKWKPLSGLPLTLGIGPMYAQDRLRGEGQHLNFHLLAVVDVTENIFTGWSHGSNCRRICNHDADTTKNPPRDMFVIGAQF